MLSPIPTVLSSFRRAGEEWTTATITTPMLITQPALQIRFQASDASILAKAIESQNPPKPTGSPTPSKGLPRKTVTGIAVGIPVAVVALIVGLSMLFITRKKRLRQEKPLVSEGNSLQASHPELDGYALRKREQSAENVFNRSELPASHHSRSANTVNVNPLAELAVD